MLRRLSRFPWSQASNPDAWAQLLHESVQAVPAGQPASHSVLLARSRCRLKWFRLASVPAGERMAALQMQAQSWQPFDESSCLYSVVGDEGVILAWDAAAASALLRQAELDPERTQLIPETLLRKPDEDGVHLIACIEGVEGQVWREGLLRSSRWWPSMPSAEEWALFLHASACAAAPLPEPARLPWLGKPWLAMQRLGEAQAAGAEARIVAIGALALALCAGFVGRQAFDVWQQVNEREQAIAQLRESGAGLADARDMALAKATQAQQWLHLLSEAQPIEVIVELHQTLGKTGVQIKEFELAGGKMKLGLQLGPQTQRADVVRMLQSGGWFVGVAETRTENAQGLMHVELSLDGLRPPAKAQQAASAPEGGSI